MAKQGKKCKIGGNISDQSVRENNMVEWLRFCSWRTGKISVYRKGSVFHPMGNAS